MVNQMKILQPKEFDTLSEADCIKIQEMLSTKVVQHSSFAMDTLVRVAGVDLAYWMEEDQEMAVCCIVVIDCKTKEILERQHSVGKVRFPYIPGCLAFRELPLVIETAAKLRQKPDVFLFDGNGILHPRGMGLATHASFYLKAPTLGVAKKYFHVDNAEFLMPENLAGSYSDIVKDGRILGRAIRTHQDVKPVFASVGNEIDIDMVTQLVIRFTELESHIPIPTRYADLQTHVEREKYRKVQ
jgi:deoxyribonuclease V